MLVTLNPGTIQPTQNQIQNKLVTINIELKVALIITKLMKQTITVVLAKKTIKVIAQQEKRIQKVMSK